MRYDVRVIITLKDGIPDIKSLEVIGGLRSLKLAEGVLGARTGKIINLIIEAPPEEIDKTVNEMCRQLLAHSVIENYDYRLTAHYAMPNGAIVKMVLANGQVYCPNDPIEPLHRQISKIDLTNKWPAIGPYRILRAEWLAKPNPLFFLIRYSKAGVESSLGWRLESSKRVFLDALEDEIGKKRGATLQKLAPEITDYLIRHIAVYGNPEPELLIEQ